MGTTDFTVPTLNALVEAGHEVLTVVCQPDRPNARGKKVVYLPMKSRALELGLPVFQPEKIKDPEVVTYLKNLKPDVFVVAAYGQILSQEVLDIPPLGSLNIHGSLLPKYRGAAPIHHAIIDGEEKTGVTIMKMDIGMDTGDMMCKVEVPIQSTDTVGILHDLLAEKGGEALIGVLDDLANGTAVLEKQDEALATYAAKVDRQTAVINWEKTSKQIRNHINGNDPFPIATTTYQGNNVKCFEPTEVIYVGKEKSGTILHADTQKGLVIKTTDGAISIGKIQMAGKKKMNTKDYLRGNVVAVGEILG